MSINISLTAYPDSDSDAQWSPMIGPLNVMLMRKFNEPIRDVLPCECGEKNVIFVARDAVRPELVFGGVVCVNPECAVLLVTVSTDEDGV